MARAERLAAAADVLVWLGDPDSVPGHAEPIKVHARADMPGRQNTPAGSIAVSAVTHEGLGALLERIAAAAREMLPPADAISLNRRQALHLGSVANALDQAAASPEPVLVAEGLRGARNAFDQLTGRAGMEDVLDALFGRFCLGK